MPTTYAHYKFGKEVLSALPRPLQNSIEAHRELFDIGLHGPDILFYYNALKKDPVNEQGHTLHEQFADEFFHHAVEVIEKAKDPAAARAYIYGFICHFALDSECHPYVEKIMQVGRVSHNEIEMELDRMMLTEDYHDPLRYLTAKHIQPKMEYAEVIAPFFKDVTAEQIYKALKGMVFYHKLFLAPTSGKLKALFLGMKAVGKYDSLHDIVMSVKPDPLCQKYCKVLKRQYSGAVPLAASLIVQYQKKLFQDTPLPERFHETFGAGEEWEKLRL